MKVNTNCTKQLQQLILLKPNNNYVLLKSIDMHNNTKLKKLCSYIYITKICELENKFKYNTYIVNGVECQYLRLLVIVDIFACMRLNKTSQGFMNQLVLFL